MKIRHILSAVAVLIAAIPASADKYEKVYSGRELDHIAHARQSGGYLPPEGADAAVCHGKFGLSRQKIVEVFHTCPGGGAVGG